MMDILEDLTDDLGKFSDPSLAAAPQTSHGLAVVPPEFLSAAADEDLTAAVDACSGVITELMRSGALER